MEGSDLTRFLDAGDFESTRDDAIRRWEFANTPVYRLAGAAASALSDARARLRAEAEFGDPELYPSVKWHLFLDEPNHVIETCAISCAVIALIQAGEHRESPLVEQGVELLRALHLRDGGWTSWVESLAVPIEREERAIVVDTYFALEALRVAGRRGLPEFAGGLQWFLRTQNPETGGWGFFEGDAAYVLPTSMALCVLGPWADSTSERARAVVAGRECLLSISDPVSDVWGRAPDAPVSAVHTAWALRALLATGVSRHDAAVVAAREWLLENAVDRDHVFDAYGVPLRTGGRSRNITHVSFADAIIPTATMAAGASLLDRRQLKLIEQLLGERRPEGHWYCHGAPHEAPIFAITDACTALRLYVDAVDTQAQFLEASDQIRRLREQVDVLELKLDDALDNTHATAGKLDAVLSDLATLRPLMYLTSIARRFPVLTTITFLLLAVGLAAYVKTGDELTLILSVAGTFATVLGIVFQVRSSAERDLLEKRTGDRREQLPEVT